MKTTTLVKRMRTHRGFTLIELIVVISVIAILATIVILAYRGTAPRSSNAVTVENVRQYINGIQLYKINTGAYPKTPDEGVKSIAMVCLGTGYAGGSCGKITGTQIYESASFMSNLQDKSGTTLKEIVNKVSGSVASESFIGAAYGIDSVGPPAPHSGYGRVIEWFLQGTNQNCGVGGAYAYNTANGNTACEFFLEVYNP